MAEKLIPTLIEQELKESYLDYSMSVIVGRALPDVRDGLKPVHRRILYAMHLAGLYHDKKFVKCARIVGDVLGKYHPHGDTSVYDALVRLGQPWSLRYTLINGQGNFGSVDGDPPAAMRYTEAKLQKISKELLQDIEKETVNFVPNFDDSTEEPVVLPSKIPNLLINGSSGIAVGMATNIPPHNVNEICDAAIAIIDNPELSFEELCNLVKGPDFPTSAEILGVGGIKLAYKTGRGRIIVRSKCEVEDSKIIVTEIPYQLNKSLLLEQIAKLVKDKIIDGISDLRDESDRNGMRIVIELKKGSNSDVVLNQLFKHSSLQTSFGVNIVGLVNGEPRQLTLRDCLDEYIKHRKEVVIRRTKFDLKKAEEREHILQGLLIALNSIDDIIALIKGSKDVSEARQGLISKYILTEIQSNAILDMKLSRLAALERQKILDEHKELLNFIREMKEILASEARIFSIIKDELIDVKNNYGDERKTNILQGDFDEGINVEDLVEDEEVVVTFTHSGYIKRQPISVYKSQKRGGRGIKGAETKNDDDFVEHLFVARNHNYILFFTDSGVVHWLKTYQIPEAGRYARGSALVNLISLGNNENITSMVPVQEFKENYYLVMATKKGIIKKTSLNEYSRPRQGGIIGINLREDDKLIDVKLTDGNKQLILATRDGRAVRFKESDVKAVGRNSIGVRGINIKKSDVIGMAVVDSPYLLTVTDKGYGKRSLVEDYRLINRGGSGVTNIKITEKNGFVVSIKVVNENDDLMLISKSGVVIRTPVKGISVIGRNTQGVRVMNLDEGDKLSTVAKIIHEDEDPEIKQEEFVPKDDQGSGDNNYEIDDPSETIEGYPVEVAKEELEKENLEVIEDREELVGDTKQEVKEENPEVNIIYFVHGTTIDNEKGFSSGWSDVELSELGIKQSIELKDKINIKNFDVVFCSDLKRAVDSARLTFGESVPIILDSRLRECNYGDYNSKPSEVVELLQEENIEKPFPNGESYDDVKIRIANFLDFLKKDYSGKNVAIVAHKAPQLALDVLVKHKTWQQAFAEDWRLKEPEAWQPGWYYKIYSNKTITKDETKNDNFSDGSEEQKRPKQDFTLDGY
ncbi:DNA gyrase subunit A [Candidatus Woesearchaeota archaeon]|nr:DNA gyrase subunit A [Candidatus Woesearchaeota archaeon]